MAAVAWGRTTPVKVTSPPVTPGGPVPWPRTTAGTGYCCCGGGVDALCCCPTSDTVVWLVDISGGTLAGSYTLPGVTITPPLEFASAARCGVFLRFTEPFGGSTRQTDLGYVIDCAIGTLDILETVGVATVVGTFNETRGREADDCCTHDEAFAALGGTVRVRRTCSGGRLIPAPAASPGLGRRVGPPPELPWGEGW